VLLAGCVAFGVAGVTADSVVLIVWVPDVALASNVDTAATEAATVAVVAELLVFVLVLSTLDVYPFVPPHPYDVIARITALTNFVAWSWFEEGVIAHSLIGWSPTLHRRNE
jgi:hypothetical protein